MPQLFEIPPPDQNESTAPREPAVRDQKKRAHRVPLGGIVRDQDAVARVERLAQVGATPEDIAVELQMPLKRLRKHFRRELERGAVRGKHDVLEKLFDNASSGANAAATSLWVKARCGWRDTGPVPESPTPIQYVLQIVTKRVGPNEKQKESPS